MLGKVSLIIVNWNGGQEPLDFLASVANLTYPKRLLEVIVVDNASTDGSLKRIKTKFPTAKILALPVNRGFPAAVNMGAHMATGDYIFIGNDDLVLTPTSIASMVHRMQHDSSIGALSGTSYFKDHPFKIASCGENFNFFLGVNYHSHHLMWVQGCALMTPTNLFDQLGHFDDHFSPGYFEDADYCVRVRKLGLRVVCDPSIRFYHSYSKSFAKLTGPTHLAIWYHSKIRFILKHAPWPWRFTSLLFHLPYCLYQRTLTIFFTSLINNLRPSTQP